MTSPNDETRLLRLELELDRIDREWEEEKIQYTRVTKYGNRYIPTVHDGLTKRYSGYALSGFITALTLAMWVTNPSNETFSRTIPMVFSVVVIGTLFFLHRAGKTDEKIALAYQSAHTRFIARRESKRIEAETAKRGELSPAPEQRPPP